MRAHGRSDLEGGIAALPAAGAATSPPERDPRRSLDARELARRWELVTPHREALLAVARRRVETREDAEDVVATALLRAVEHPGLDEARVGPLLCTMVMRLAVDTHRDRARQLATGKRVASRELEAASPEDDLCDHAQARWLQDQLTDLPTRERQVLDARLAGLSAQQTSKQLGLSVKATENAYSRVRSRARTHLGKLSLMLLVPFVDRLSVMTEGIGSFAVAV